MRKANIMKDKFMISTYETLKKIIQKYNPEDLEVRVSFNDLVHIVGDKFDDDLSITEFRYVNLLGRIIVSRISFLNKRSGCLSECMNYLYEEAKKYEISCIIIQCVSTIPMAQWCEKNGYSLIDNLFSSNFPIKGSRFMYGDYIKEVL